MYSNDTSTYKSNTQSIDEYTNDKLQYENKYLYKIKLKHNKRKIFRRNEMPKLSALNLLSYGYVDNNVTIMIGAYSD